MEFVRLSEKFPQKNYVLRIFKKPQTSVEFPRVFKEFQLKVYGISSYFKNISMKGLWNLLVSKTFYNKKSMEFLSFQRIPINNLLRNISKIHYLLFI